MNEAMMRAPSVGWCSDCLGESSALVYVFQALCEVNMGLGRSALHSQISTFGVQTCSCMQLHLLCTVWLIATSMRLGAKTMSSCNQPQKNSEKKEKKTIDA
jgi:hypothetical protein